MTNTETTPGTNATTFGAFVQLVFALYFLLEGPQILGIPFIIMIGIIAIMQRYTAVIYDARLHGVYHNE